MSEREWERERKCIHTSMSKRERERKREKMYTNKYVREMEREFACYLMAYQLSQVI